MKKTTIWIIIGLMAIAMVGIISLQAGWISRTIRLNEEQFDNSVSAAIYKVAERMEAMESVVALESMNGFESVFLEEELRQILRQDDKGLLNIPEKRSEYEQLPNDRLAAYLLNQNNCDCEACRLDRQIKYYQIMRKRLESTKLSLSERIGDLPRFHAMLVEELNNAGVTTFFHYGIYSNESNNFIINDGHFVVPNVSEHVTQIGGFDQLLNSHYRVALFPEGNDAAGFLMLYFPDKASAIWGSMWVILISSIIFIGIILFSFFYAIRIIFRQKKISEMKNDFINNMTHEFKTPIATISLAADAIGNKNIAGDPSKVKRFSDIIREENRRMNHQVERVLQMAQIDKQDYSLNITDLDIHEIILNAVATFAIQVENREGHIETHLDASNHLLEGDRTHLSGLIHNLLDNANKYSPEKPHIIIRTRNRPKGIEIAIQDHGIGMTREARKHIFEKFYRIHTGNLHDVKGFGLGLSYVKTMVDAHHGKVAVDSEPGKGSTFTLFFPFKHEITIPS